MAESAVSYLLQKLVLITESEVNLMKGARDVVVSMRRELELMKAFLRIADGLEESDEEVKVWVKQVRDVGHEAEDALDELALLQAHNHADGSFFSLRRFSCCIKNMKDRYRIVSELCAINSRMKTIFSVRSSLHSKFDNAAQVSSSSIYTGNAWQDQRGDALLLDNFDLVGIEKPKKKLVSWLVIGSSRCKVFSVTGMGGMGKTTLVKKVYDDAQVRQHFGICVWITVSQSYNIHDLVTDMAQKLLYETRRLVPNDLKRKNTNELKVIIKDLLEKRRYLVILDDVWQIHEWDAIKHVLPNNDNGSRVLITTRKFDIATISSIESNGEVYDLRPLAEDESWELFRRKTFQGKPCPNHLVGFCKYILRKCDGLPLAIVAISGVLATKDTSKTYEWYIICKSLGAEILRNDKLENLKTVLSLSINDLPYYLKSCYLYLSIFPEDYLIHRMRLIRLWIAEGFVEAKEGKTLEEIAENYLNELLNRNLIQLARAASDGRVKWLRIHDILREIIIHKSRDQNFVAIFKEHSAPWPDKIHRLSVHNTLPNSQQKRLVSQIRSFFVFGVIDEISLHALFPTGFRLLKVLDFQNANLHQFPLEIVGLYHLRYLSLRNTKVKMIPSDIGKLQNLEILDLKKTFVTKLPVEILKLQRLTYLLIYNFEATGYAHFNSKYGFEALSGIGKLQSLQKLCFIEGCGMIMSELGKLTQLRRLGIMKLREEDGKHLCYSLERMTSLHSLSVTSSHENEMINLQQLSSPPQFLNRLYLTGCLKDLPNWIPSLVSLTRLFLKWSRLRKDPLVFIQDLPNLAHLELLQVYDGEKLCFKSQKFPKLKVLGLDKFDKLRWVEIEKGALPSLENLIIQRCDLLHAIPSGIQHLTWLKGLELFDMPNEFIMALRPDGQGKDHWKVAHIPEVYTAYWKNGDWDIRSTNNCQESSVFHKPRTLWKV